MEKFITMNYWFNVNAGELEPKMQKLLFIILVIFLILAIFISVIKKSKQNGFYYKIFNSLQLFFITNFIVGVFLYFFTYQGIYFLSSRFWFLAWFVFVVIWLNTIRSLFLKIPKIKEKVKEKEKYSKYIP